MNTHFQFSQVRSQTRPRASGLRKFHRCALHYAFMFVWALFRLCFRAVIVAVLTEQSVLRRFYGIAAAPCNPILGVVNPPHICDYYFRRLGGRVLHMTEIWLIAHFALTRAVHHLAVGTCRVLCVKVFGIDDTPVTH